MIQHDSSSPDPDAPATDAEAPVLKSVVVEYENKPDECTIFPANTDDDERTTTWISAAAGGFVDLDEMR